MPQLLTFILLVTTSLLFAQKAPFFIDGNDPKPSGTKWELVKSMSDEFKGKHIDENKWQISGQGWIGRAPGLFLPENIEVSDGSLKITATKLEKPIVKQNKTFTHGGGYVGSRAAMKYGYYECEMKANKTFMSSTFWLINNKRNASGCQKRTTELDIQECVGQIVNDAAWMHNFDRQMNSNTHSRDIPVGCDYVKGVNRQQKVY
ncbi:MAG: family 16 glycosylhydrolase [Bacteroidetes bacterium]|nr:family 16 glycosylhydrolase [Bacteroidota bacterium]